MKYHIVINNRMQSVKGQVESKDIFKRIKEERPDKDYKLVSLKEDEIGEKLKEELRYKEAWEVYGRMMFDDEYEVFQQSFDQMLMDIYARIHTLVKDQLPLLKLKDEDKLAVEAYAHFMFDFIREAQNSIENDDEVFEEDVYFKPEKLADTIIDQYG